MGKLTFIDLFAGAGGLSEGFIRKDFAPVSHIEMDTHSCQTIKTRMVYHWLRMNRKLDVYRKYLTRQIAREELYSLTPTDILDSIINTEITEDNYKNIINKIQHTLKKQGYSEVDLVVGGPPCQAYSLVGRARDPYSKERDPRNHLYKLYSKFLENVKPRVFVFENVPGLLSAGKGELFRDVVHHFDEAGYHVEHKMLYAYQFGVLQKRKRVILIGWRKGLKLAYPQFGDLEENGWQVKDVLMDLPSIQPGESILYGMYITNPPEYLQKHKIRDDNDVLTLHIARNHNERDRYIYGLAIRKWEKHGKRLMYTDVPEKYRTHKNIKSFLDRYRVVAANLPFSHTVVAHIAKDGHYYIHPDIEQRRSLSIREAARLQSFPDNYFFEGSMTSRFMQIGNAVPPLMAEKIAEKIRVMLA